MLKVEWVSSTKLCAVDAAGSLVFFEINEKKIMDKHVVTSVS